MWILKVKAFYPNEGAGTRGSTIAAGAAKSL
jgi:hypothetical protein